MIFKHQVIQPTAFLFVGIVNCFLNKISKCDNWLRVVLHHNGKFVN